MTTSPIHLDIPACQRGDRDAQRVLFEEFHHRVYRLAVRIVGQSDADDLTQQIFLKVYQKIQQFQQHSQFKTWLFRLATNECLQHLRSQSRNTNVSLEIDPVDSAPNVAMALDESELLEVALSRLEPELRTVFQLREVEMLNYSELAETLQISEGTVGSRLNRARTLLREHLIELGWDH